jgi:hypothetical protein
VKQNEVKVIRTSSIKYVYDSDACTKWFDAYLSMLIEELYNDSSKENDGTYIHNERSELIFEEYSRILSELNRSARELNIHAEI